MSKNLKNAFLFDKQEFESLKKITKTTEVSDYAVLTDNGFVDIVSLHETIPYDVYQLNLLDGKELKCADNHIVFYSKNNQEVFVKDLISGDKILINQNDNLSEGEVKEVINLGYKEIMYDLELSSSSNRRYYTNGILSHNTHLAKQLAKQLFGNEKSLIRVDMSEYQEKHTISRLIGSPPGYVGHDEGGQLTEKVKNNPYSIILFDEIEKAHKDVFNLLLQILDEGHLTDSLGKTVNFKNTIIILTTNLGIKKFQDFGTGISFTSSKYGNEVAKKEMLMKELKKFFSPEFLNRIDDTIVFNTLNDENVKKITEIELNKLITRLTESNYIVSFDSSVIDLISKVGFDETYGARPIKRAIQDKIEDLISDEVLNGFIKENKPYHLIVEDENVIIKKGVK